MITKYTLIFLKIPFQFLMFLVSPTYFKNTINHKGKILITNDNVLSANFSKPGRRVVVTSDDGKNIKVNKITKDKSFLRKRDLDAIAKQKLTSVSIDYKKYPKVLNKPSVIDNKIYEVNQITKSKFTINDSEFNDTGIKLTRGDMKKINKKINK